jgi:hypothetical protein
MPSQPSQSSLLHPWAAIFIAAIKLVLAFAAMCLALALIGLASLFQG